MLSHTVPFEFLRWNCKKKQITLAMYLDSFPDNSRASPAVCFETIYGRPITQNYNC
jgi:hypothetical protein